MSQPADLPPTRLTHPAVDDGDPTPTVAEAGGDHPPALATEPVERYALEEEVGRGGMGVVLRVRDTALGRSLALKVLLEEHRGQPELVRRFLEEGRIMAQLQHPGVPPVHDLGYLPDGRPFFAMKLIKGRTLAELLRQRTNPTEEWPRLLAVFEHVCQTLGYAHSKGVLHRDLKPSNVMVGAFGEVQVMDWGLAKLIAPVAGSEPAAPAREAAEPSTIFSLRTAVDEPSTQAGRVLGTLAYMAPEQARGEVGHLDERADVFGLGAVLCVLLTGQPPFAGSNKEEVHRRARHGELADAFARLDGCGADAELVALAKTCLAAQKEARPRNAGAVAGAVATYQQGVQQRLRQAELERARAQTRAEEARATARAERRARRLTLGLALAALLLVLGGGSGAWLLQRQHAAALARRQEADRATGSALERARALLDDGWRDNDVRQLTESAAEADKAAEVAHSGAASDAVRQEADTLRRQIAEKLGRARRNDALLLALSDVALTPETRRYVREESGAMAALAEPTLDEQFATAFRRWGLDIDRTLTTEAAARLRAQPQRVGEEVVAALDVWTLTRQGDKRRGADWQRLLRLAEQFDPSDRRRQVRRLLVSGQLRRERIVGGLTRLLLPWSALCESTPNDGHRQLRQWAAQVDPVREPVLGVVTLARALSAAGAEADAEKLLRATLAARPNGVVLLTALGKQLEGRGRLGEAIECYRAVRAVQPQLGVVLSKALVAAGRAGEGETILRALYRKQPDNPELSFYLGVVLLDQKRLAEAEAACRRAIALQPDFAAAHNNLGVVLRDQKKLTEAEAACRRAIALQPDFAAAHNNLGNALHDQKRLAEAEAAYRRAIALQPYFAMAHYNLGVILHDQKKLAEAEAAYRRAIALQPDLAKAHSNLGVILHDQKKLAEAEAAYRRAIALQPDYALAYNNLGAVLHDQKRLGEAEATYRRAIALQPDYAGAHYNLGIVLHAQKRLAEAEAAFRRAIALKPDDALAYNNLGIFLRGQKRLREAEAAYRRAIALQPDDALAYNNLGAVLHAQKRLAEAEAAFRRAIALKPDDARAHNNLGIFLRGQKRLAEAEAAYRRAIALQPDDAIAHNNLGNALADQKKLGEAETAFRRAIELKPDDATAHYNLGLALHAQKKLAESEAACRRAIALQPNYADAYVNLGNALRDQKKLVEAEAAYRRAIALQPDYAKAHFNLGDALSDQKRLAEAEAAYRKAIALQPDNAAAHYNLGLALHAQKRLGEAEAAYRKALALQPDLAEAHCNLGHVLSARGCFAEALASLRRGHSLGTKRAGWPYPSARWVQQTQQMLALDRKLAAVLEGKAKPEGVAERLGFAQLCADPHRRYATAARFYAEALAADPKLADNLGAGHRYNAACCAALAAVGKGEDATKLDDKERGRLRQQALAWLRVDLDAWSKRLAKGLQPERLRIQRTLAGWQQDADLASVRAKDAPEKLPPDERQQWQKLWADVAALRKRVE